MFYNLESLTFCVPQSGPVTISGKTVYDIRKPFFFCTNCGFAGHTCITRNGPCNKKPEKDSIVENRFSHHPAIQALLRESSRKQTKKSANKTHHAKDCSVSRYDCLRNDTDDEKPFVQEHDDEPEQSKAQLMKKRESSYDVDFPAFPSTPVKPNVSFSGTTFRDSLATPLKVNTEPTCPGAPLKLKWERRQFDKSVLPKCRNAPVGPMPSLKGKNFSTILKRSSLASDSESDDEEVTGASLAEDLDGYEAVDAW